MEIKTETRDKLTLIQLIGNLDGTTVAQAQEQLMPLANNKSCMALDLSKCNYISSAGLRLLLMLAKQCTAQESSLALVSLCDEVKDVMDMTGFISFFKLYNSIEDVAATIK